MTISFWIKPNTDTFKSESDSGYVNLLGKGEYKKHEWNFRVYGQDSLKDYMKGRFIFSLYNTDGTGVSSYSQNVLTEGEWTNILVKVDNGMIYLYSNGELIDSDSYEGKVNPTNTDSSLRIGTRDTRTFFDGSLIDLAIFENAISDEEIREIVYRGPRFRLTEDSDIYHSSDNLAAYYKLNDDDSLITDYSGHKLYGTFYSGNKKADPFLISIDDTSSNNDENVPPVIEEPEISQSEGIYFDGNNDYIEIEDSDDFSVDTTGEYTISVWIKSETLSFDKDLSSGYIHWMGKGEPNKHEWTFRMYSADNTAGRENRISFYLFNNDGGLGAGSYVQENVKIGEWVHIVAKVDNKYVYLYKNGVLKDKDRYYESPYWITPENSNAPVRIGSREMKSFFEGNIAEVAMFNKALSSEDINEIYEGNRAFNFENEENLVALYRLDKKSEKITDETGNNNGILNN
jgi:hypothetical protein